jgi:hypothetical protein
MSNSSHRKLKKNLAIEIEAEIITINLESSSLKEDLTNIAWDDMKTLNFDELRRLRMDLQNIKSSMQRVHLRISRLSSKDVWGVETVDIDGVAVQLNHRDVRRLNK